jgi:prepilin-type N-terminal cleavage/methylation domain-containing protein
MLRNKKFLTPAFTLIEMLVVVSILSVISVAIYAALSNGIKIWQRINTILPEEGISIFMEKLTSDLKNAVKFQSLSFIGEEDNVEFVKIIQSHRLEKMTVGKTAYLLDNASGMLKRHEKDISHIYQEKDGVAYDMLAGVEGVNFWYYRYDKDNDDYIWEREWDRQGLPLAVRVEFIIGKENASEKFTKTISMPVGG